MRLTLQNVSVQLLQRVPPFELPLFLKFQKLISMDQIDIIISFDVFKGISDQYFVEKNHTNFFCKKKLSQIFVRVPPLELA